MTDVPTQHTEDIVVNRGLRQPIDLYYVVKDKPALLNRRMLLRHIGI